MYIYRAEKLDFDALGNLFTISAAQRVILKLKIQSKEVPRTQHLPCHSVVEQSQELFERGLVHTVNHAHLNDQEIQDTATGGH